MHGNTGKFRRTDERGQLPLLLGANDAPMCPIHGIAMTMIVERRSKGGKQRVRYRCPHCESDRHLDVEALIARLEAEDWPSRLGCRQRELLPPALVEKYDAVMAERAVERKRLNNKKRHLRLRLERFGLSEAKYRLMIQEQDGRCAICGIQPDDPESLAIDHCHENGHVRGLLCLNCNTAIGSFQDSPAIMFSAIDYLNERAA